MKIINLALYCVLACGVVDLSMAASAEKTRTVLIGLPTTFGTATHDAAQLAIEAANKQNLRIQGEKIVFKVLLSDDKNDPNLAVLVARSMVAAGVTAVIGHRTTDTSVAVAGIYNQAGIPMIAPAAAGRALTQLRYRNVFQAIGSTDITAGYLAAVLVRPIQATRIMLIDSDNILGRELVDSVARALSARGVTAADRQSISAKTSDFSGVLSRIKAINPEVIFYTGFPPQSTAFAERLKQTGDNQRLLIAGGGINPEFPASAGHYVDGVWMLGYGMPLDKTPGIKPLETAYKARFKSQFIPQTLFVYDAVGMLVEAIRQANSLDGPVITEVLHAIKYQGISRPISFDVNGSLMFPLYTLYQVRDGTWKTIKRYP